MLIGIGTPDDLGAQDRLTPRMCGFFVRITLTSEEHGHPRGGRILDHGSSNPCALLTRLEPGDKAFLVFLGARHESDYSG